MGKRGNDMDNDYFVAEYKNKKERTEN